LPRPVITRRLRKKGFVTAGKADEVQVFDTSTLKVTAKVKTGKKPDAVVYDPASKRVFAMNGDGDSTTVINAADNSVARTIDLGGGPEFTVVDGRGKLWVNLEDQSELVQIDTNELKVLHHWPVASCTASFQSCLRCKKPAALSGMPEQGAGGSERGQQSPGEDLSDWRSRGRDRV
jgi:YVTN family beta-propeller protein